MNIEITKPEVEAILQRSLRKSGLSRAEDVIFVALREFDAKLQGGVWVGDHNSTTPVLDLQYPQRIDVELLSNDSAGAIQRAIESLSAIARDVSRALQGGDAKRAKRELVRLESPLAELQRWEALGDPILTVVEALHLAIIQLEGDTLSSEMWREWVSVAEELSASPPGGIKEASLLSRRLDAVGWNTEPEQFRTIAEILEELDRE